VHQGRQWVQAAGEYSVSDRLSRHGGTVEARGCTSGPGCTQGMGGYGEAVGGDLIRNSATRVRAQRTGGCV